MTTIPSINYEIIADALRFYEDKGYIPIDVPWMVSEEAIKSTCPPGMPLFDTIDGALVASAEQSFIELMLQGKLSPGRYCACTPCFRADEVNSISWRRFLKVELIHYGVEGDPEPLIANAEEFMSSYLPVRRKETKDGVDLVTPSGFSPHCSIELGSYGKRSFQSHTWAYGTGVAEPRFSQQINVGGYHESIIPRGKVGTAAKIVEELREFLDAQRQANKIMALVELSDLYGAINHLLASDFPSTTMDDLRIMASATERAFRSGRRS